MEMSNPPVGPRRDPGTATIQIFLEAGPEPGRQPTAEAKGE